MNKLLNSLFIILTIVLGTVSALALAILMAMGIDWLFSHGDMPAVTGFAQGEILLYVGNVLPFIATLILSTLVLWQNFKLSEVNDKLQRRGEEMQEKDLIHKSFNFLHIVSVTADFVKDSGADETKHIVLKSTADSAVYKGETTDIVFNFEAKADSKVPVNEIEIETFELILDDSAQIFRYEATKGEATVFDVHKFVSGNDNDEDHMFLIACKVEGVLQDILRNTSISDNIKIKFDAAYVNVLNVKVCLTSTINLQVEKLESTDEAARCDFKVAKEVVIFTGEISVKPDETGIINA